MSEVTNLRQSNAKVHVNGIVSSKDLKIDQKDGANIITGSVSVEVDETNIIHFTVYAKEKTKDGKDNPSYTGLVTVMNEYKTIADNGRDEADRVYVHGDLNPFVGKNGRETVGQRASFFNRVQKLEDFEPKAEFEVEIYIANISPEVDKDGNETGRLKVRGWMPTYNGIEPLNLICPAENVGGFENAYSVGQTAELDGDIINSRVEKRTEIPMAFGKPKVKVETTYKNELVITGGSEPYEEGVSQFAPYDKGAIDLAITEREARLAAKENAPKSTTSAPSGSGRQIKFF